jgi:paired amphipathic helix protein Sin3a
MGGPRGRSVLSVRQEEEEDEPANGRASLMRSGPKLNLTKNRGLRSVNDDEIELYDLNLDACERVGPSYVKVPSNVRLQKCSGKDSIGAKVLNDHLVCTPSGAEGSFKDSAKNPHEETLFKVEDDQLEMDMLIGKFTSLIAALKKLQEALLKGTWRRDDPEQIYVTGTPLFILKARSSCVTNKRGFLFCLTGSHAYALRVMFKEEYLDTLKQLKQDPARIVDSVLEKVQCKCDNLVTGRWRWRMIWRAVQRKSSMSSLDVQGHVYRTDDKIKTHPKQLIALLREQYFDSVKQGKITDFHLSYQLSKQTPEFFEDMVRLVGTAGATIIQNPPELKMVRSI